MTVENLLEVRFVQWQESSCGAIPFRSVLLLYYYEAKSIFSHSIDMADPKAQALKLKEEGNAAYKAKQFAEASSKYSQAWETDKDITCKLVFM